MPDGSEQRKAPRVRVSIPVMLGISKNAEPRPLLGQVQNISLGGAFIQTREPVEVGEEIQVTIPTAGAPDLLDLPRTVRGSGVVRRTRKGGAHAEVAIKFTPSLAESIDFACFMSWLSGNG